MKKVINLFCQLPISVQCKLNILNSHFTVFHNYISAQRNDVPKNTYIRYVAIMSVVILHTILVSHIQANGIIYSHIRYSKTILAQQTICSGMWSKKGNQSELQYLQL